MQTVERKPVRRLEFEELSLTAKIAGGVVIGFGVLLIWSLVLLASENTTLSDVRADMNQQQKVIGDMQTQMTDNERKREADTTVLMNATIRPYANSVPAPTYAPDAFGSTSGLPSSGTNGATNVNPSQSQTPPN